LCRSSLLRVCYPLAVFPSVLSSFVRREGYWIFLSHNINRDRVPLADFHDRSLSRGQKLSRGATGGARV
jgi:hypothetical protein